MDKCVPVLGPMDDFGLQIPDIKSLFKFINYSNCIYKDKFKEIKSLPSSDEHCFYFSFSSSLNRDMMDTIRVMKKSSLVPLAHSTFLPSEDLFKERSKVLVKHNGVFGFIYNNTDSIFGLLSNNFDFIENSDDYPDEFLSPPDVGIDEFLFLPYSALVIEKPQELFSIVKRSSVRNYYYKHPSTQSPRLTQIKVKTEPATRSKSTATPSIPSSAAPSPAISISSYSVPSRAPSPPHQPLSYPSSAVATPQTSKPLQNSITSTPVTPSTGLIKDETPRGYTSRIKNYINLKKVTDFADALSIYTSKKLDPDALLRVTFVNNIRWRRDLVFNTRDSYLTPNLDMSPNILKNIDYFEKLDMNLHLFYNPVLLENWDDLWVRLVQNGWKKVNKALLSKHIEKIPAPYRDSIQKYDDIYIFSPILEERMAIFTPGVNLFVSAQSLRLYITKFPYPLQTPMRFLETIVLHNWEIDIEANYCAPGFNFDAVSIQSPRKVQTYNISKLKKEIWINPAKLFQNYLNLSPEKVLDCFRLNLNFFYSTPASTDMRDTTISKLDFTDPPEPPQMVVNTNPAIPATPATSTASSGLVAPPAPKFQAQTPNSTKKRSATDISNFQIENLSRSRTISVKTEPQINNTLLNDPKYPQIINPEATPKTEHTFVPASPPGKIPIEPSTQTDPSTKKIRVAHTPKTPMVESQSLNFLDEFTPVQNHIKNLGSISTPISTPSTLPNPALPNPTPRSTTRTPMIVRPPPKFKK